LCCLFFFDLRILITPLVSFGHCVVCSFLIYGFVLPLWYRLAICCLFVFDLRILITPLVSFFTRLPVSLDCTFLITPSVFSNVYFALLYFILPVVTEILICKQFVTIRHTEIICSFLIYGFLLPLWYLLAIVLSVLFWFTDSYYPFGIFWPLCCLFFLRYHRGNQNPYIEEEQTTQWPKDTKGVIRIRKSKKNRQHNGQKIPQG
jgi:hypothetical protein